MKCSACKEKILQSDAKVCPYCGSRVILSDDPQSTLEEIEKLVRAGRYEDAALEYEELEMWDKAGECRRNAKTNYVVTANLSIGKVGSISMDCPHCGASHPIASKFNEVKCQFCGKNYIIPKKVLDLL